MSEDYGADFISVTDEDGNEFELEHLGTLEHKGVIYMAFVPADMDEEDEDFGMIILQVMQDENGEDILADVEDAELLNDVYEQFMEEIFADEDEEN